MCLNSSPPLPARNKTTPRAVASLLAAGVACVDAQYVVDWVAHPWAPLAPHYRHGSQTGAALAELEAGRAAGV